MRKEIFSNTNRKSLLNDLVLIFAVLAVAVIALFVFKATQKEGNRVIVTVRIIVISRVIVVHNNLLRV